MTKVAGKISSIEELEALYGAANPRSLEKEVDHIAAPYRKLIEASPFLVIASVGPEGVDCSPRGDPAGFVHIEDDRTLLLPDRRGNNRADTLKNIVRDPRVALIFFIPGVGETLRVNGKAEILIDPDLLARFEMQGKLPRSVVSIHVEAVYFQCQKALARSRLWDPAAHVDRATLPSAGDILSDLGAPDFDGPAYDAAYPARMKETIY